ncbi:MAG: hypothetical protein ACK2UI_04275, partial [Anaerolineae bacterium]
MTNEHEGQQKRSLSWGEFFIERAIQISGISAIILLVLIFLFIIKEGTT